MTRVTFTVPLREHFSLPFIFSQVSTLTISVFSQVSTLTTTSGSFDIYHHIRLQFGSVGHYLANGESSNETFQLALVFLTRYFSYFSPGLPFHPYHLNSRGFEPCDYRRHHPHDYLSSQLGLHHHLAVRSIRPPHPGDQSLFPSSDLTNSELTGACLIWSGHGGGSRQGPRLPPPLRPPLRHALCLVGHHHNDPRH